jgi:hypothetical protein
VSAYSSAVALHLDAYQGQVHASQQALSPQGQFQIYADGSGSLADAPVMCMYIMMDEECAYIHVSAECACVCAKKSGVCVKRCACITSLSSVLSSST